MKNDFIEMQKLIDKDSDNPKARKANRLKKPSWLKKNKNDRLHEIYEKQDEFWSSGRIALGCIVQANNRLFYMGTSDNCPANFIYTYEDYYYEHLGEFKKLAHEIYSLRTCNDEMEESQKYIADLLNAETKRDYHIAVPENMTDGRKVFITTIMVEREHIPMHKLCNAFYPMLTIENASDSPDAIILPKWYWYGFFTYYINFLCDNKIRPVMPEESCFNANDMITIGAGRAFRREHPIAYIIVTFGKILACIVPLYILISAFTTLKISVERFSGIGFIGFWSGFLGCRFLSVGMISYIGSFMEQYMGDKYTKNNFIAAGLCILFCVLFTVADYMQII